MSDRVWQVPQDQFVAAWNGAETLDAASACLRDLAGGNVPGWAALQRAQELRKSGIELKKLVRAAPLPVVK